ncbi:hypothetical protein [Novosphingobium sp. PASSN1]|uniref:hypothetical protein n=1 Tax=Novosphingobium sp. PASSN1 TaxID=2015561 RepID=UPI000BCE50B3|nr:hypothetical protein [Novosphingobium sp. PASSN1]OYU34513.1 MAG: hypothetical protein CFE35_14030 [Novosphingobium sp. PASSN1]
MWIRSAFWTGEPVEPEVFDKAINAELVPALGKLPGVSSARALWPRRLEDGPPAIYCQIIVEFADLAALETMLASAERRAMRERVREVAASFNGHISHIDYEVGVAG